MRFTVSSGAPPGRLGRLLWSVAVPIGVVMAAALVARAYDTSWIVTGHSVSSTSLKSDLDEIQTRLAALEASSPTSLNASRVYRSTAQAIPNNTDTAISFDSTRFDFGSQWSASTPTRLTAKVAGVYAMGTCIEFFFNSTASRQLSILLNGTTTIADQLMPPNPINTPAQCISTLYSLAQNDYVEVHVYQGSGGMLNVDANPSFSPEFWMHRVR